jgi:hypothetical protein
MSAISKIIFSSILGYVCLLGVINAQDNSEDDKPVDNKPAAQAEAIEANLVYSDDWSVLAGISTPLPIITQINNNYVNLPNPENKKGFRCVAEPSKARLDVDGDDELDTDIKTKEQFVNYKLTYPNGLKMNYKLRVFTGGKSLQWSTLWSFQRGCFMTAKTPIETFTLIDDDTNGYYGDYGKDAIAIGASKQAGPLSSIINVKGKFYKLEVQTLVEISATQMKDPKFTGMVLRLTPCEEETGKLDLVKNLKPPKGAPQAIIVRRGEDAFFQLSGKGETVLPVGEYYLVSAIFTKRIRARTSEKPMAMVEAGQTVAPKWGAPFTLQISAFSEKGGTEIIVIPPGNLTPPQDVSKNLDCPFIKTEFPKILGSLGEEYYAPDEFKDERGYALPDEGIMSFNIDIRPKGAPAADKPLNKRGNPFTDRWIQTDMSGLVQKSIPYWQTYSCPIERYRGAVIFKATAKSAVFGELSFEKEIEVAE